MKAKLEKVRDDLECVLMLANQYTICETKHATDALSTLAEITKELDSAELNHRVAKAIIDVQEYAISEEQRNNELYGYKEYWKDTAKAAINVIKGE